MELFVSGALEDPKHYQLLSFLLVAALVRVYIAATKHQDQKQSLGGKGLLGLQFHTVVHHWRKSG